MTEKLHDTGECQALNWGQCSSTVGSKVVSLNPTVGVRSLTAGSFKVRGSLGGVLTPRRWWKQRPDIMDNLRRLRLMSLSAWVTGGTSGHVLS